MIDTSNRRPINRNALVKLIKTVKGLSSIDTSLIRDMNNVFHGNSFNQPLNNWDVSNVTEIWCMFNYATSFNQPLNNWDVSNVTNMCQMFCNAESFNQPLNKWNVSKVISIEGMFGNAIKYTHSMSKWKLRRGCKTKNFLKNCIMWYRFNDEDDMPLKGNKRLIIPIKLKNLWEK